MTNEIIEDILTSDSKLFLQDLVRNFKDRLDDILRERDKRQKFYDVGYLPDFSPDTSDIRDEKWKISEIPSCLLDRRVEITGPTDRKMVINALNSGANVFMADFEDSLSPTWENIISGQLNLKDAVRETISYEHPTKGTYRLNSEHAVLFVRPRGLHLKESHFLVDGNRVPASLFDFGLFMFHNAKILLERKRGPFFYLPKLEHHSEASWWNDVFNWTQDRLNIPRKSIKATVLIETLPAAFQMDEILYELKDHSAGLNCGRWDYIFSFIKTVRNHNERIFPDRDQVTMTSHCMKSYSELLIYTCHKRGAHAMGGMAAQIPIKNDEDANSIAIKKVREDKLREVLLGHDGTWVAHPGLIQVAREIFDSYMPNSNQISDSKGREPSREDLLRVPLGSISEKGLSHNLSVGIQYIESWLRGNGCVPLYNLMEDAATAEISRTQVWQWRKHNCSVESGETIDVHMINKKISEVLESIEKEVGSDRFNSGKFDESVSLFREMVFLDELPKFLTIDAYEHIK